MNQPDDVLLLHVQLRTLIWHLKQTNLDLSTAALEFLATTCQAKIQLNLKIVLWHDHINCPQAVGLLVCQIKVVDLHLQTGISRWIQLWWNTGTGSSLWTCAWQLAWRWNRKRLRTDAKLCDVEKQAPIPYFHDLRRKNVSPLRKAQKLNGDMTVLIYLFGGIHAIDLMALAS